MIREKEKIRWSEDGEKAEKKRQKLLSRVRQHYSHVLHLFDEAIREVEKSEVEGRSDVLKCGTKRKAEEEPTEELERVPQPSRRTRSKRS